MALSLVYVMMGDFDVRAGYWVVCEVLSNICNRWGLSKTTSMQAPTIISFQIENGKFIKKNDKIKDCSLQKS